MRTDDGVLAVDQVVLVAAHPATPGCAQMLVSSAAHRWQLAEREAVQAVMGELIAESARSAPLGSVLTARILLTIDAVVVQVLDAGAWIQGADLIRCRRQSDGYRVLEQVVPLAIPRRHSLARSPRSTRQGGR